MKTAQTAALQATGLKRALVYLRVSTDKQTHRDNAPEGYSLPAQREACHRKASELGAEVVTEFVDPGASGRNSTRKGLQDLLAKIKEQGGVDFVIVHKINRWSRNRIEDGMLLLAVEKMGARLVSVTENIDQTPAGRLLHGILASIAEFESLNLGTEIQKGFSQKVKFGGTPTLAPLGYVNVRKLIDGHEVRTVEVDPDRAPHVVWAFETYAQGNHSLSMLVAELTSRGLTTRPNRRSAAKPLHTSSLAKLLTNPYYTGVVTYHGARYPGRHEALISPELFERVQRTLETNRNGEKVQHHQHYLKGTLYCARCAHRICLTYAKGNGGTYPYFFCLGRQQGNGCDQPYLPMDDVEEQVLAFYRSYKLHPKIAAPLRRDFRQQMREDRMRLQAEAETQSGRLETLRDQRRKLLDLHYQDKIASDLFAEEQERISREMSAAMKAIDAGARRWKEIEAGFDEIFAMMDDFGGLYAGLVEAERRSLNRALWSKILVDSERELQAEMTDLPTTAQAKPYFRRAARVMKTSLANVMKGWPNATNPATFTLAPGSNILILVELSSST